jgi:hypothetical protein
MFNVVDFDMSLVDAVTTTDVDPMVVGLPEMRPVTESI